MSIITQQQLDTSLSSVEKVANLPGYVPFVSEITGCLRIKSGILETIVSIAVFLFNRMQYAFTGDKNYLIDSDKALQYLPHGLANIFRGIVECIPIIGNLACWIYDGRPMPFIDTKPHRFEYPTEKYQFQSV